MLSALLILATAATGASAGLIGGMLGIGGGVIAIPLLGLLFGFDQRVAQGTTLVMVAPNVVLAFWRYCQHGGVDLRIAATLAISAGLSTYPAALFATGLDPGRLRLAFAAFLISLAAFVAGQTWLARPQIVAAPALTTFFGSAGRSPRHGAGVGGAGSRRSIGDLCRRRAGRVGSRHPARDRRSAGDLGRRRSGAPPA
jgi:uncharacterized membrane protein YfcA